MINVLYTKIGDPMKAWVARKVKERNEKMVKDNFIEMDPAVHAAFLKSTSISCKSDYFYFLIILTSIL